ncbi:MAG: M24 family metallopeptidase [Candidatus Sungbacteria bacterium]|uniref:Methionine aminopeptidase n=1 Tax=Candidatus Sungiibacteriota bacterium TaxID=2750080 RepID=A0A933DR71_9BACT|nr:M24 family metallopeptidase [Candidatus Sungbacteria bacterium]
MIASRPEELATLRECGKRLAVITAELAAAVRPGMSTFELDELALRLIRQAGGEPVFKGYRAEKDGPPFPASLCTSINDEVVHGIPRRERRLLEGDIIGLDIGMLWPASAGPARPAGGAAAGKPAGLITDMAVTIPVGNVSPRAGRLLVATSRALAEGIRVLKPGIRLGDLGHAIQQVIEAQEFSVVRDLVGHGVGRRLHEEPFVPNYGMPGTGKVIREGMVLAIEPMATVGSPSVRLADDGWTWCTADGSLAAHFEHTVLVRRDGAEVLTL